MARQGNLNADGSVRVTQTDDPAAAFVADSNNGAFDQVTATGVGDSDVIINDNYLIGEADVVLGQVGGTAPGTINVIRLAPNNLRVRTWGALAVAAALPYSLTIVRRFFG